MESEPPYQYVRGNPVNRIDPSGNIPRLSEVGTRQHYSCKCGWIDRGHAGSRLGLIEEVKKVRDGQNLLGIVGDNFRNLTPNNLEILGLRVEAKFTSGDFIVERQAVMGQGYLSVALGMMIAYENFFERTQGEFPFWLAKSSFSNEDLVSDLIGFHIGVGQDTGNGPKSFEDAMELCEVVGLEHFDRNNRNNPSQEYVDIQQQIWWDYVAENGKFEQHHQWGSRPPGRWNGSITSPGSCSSKRCGDQTQLPAALTRIRPRPPGDGWLWTFAQVQTASLLNPRSFVDPNRRSIRNFDTGTLNQLPLNWAGP